MDAVVLWKLTQRLVVTNGSVALLGMGQPCLVECCRRDEFSVWMSLKIVLNLVPVYSKDQPRFSWHFSGKTL